MSSENTIFLHPSNDRLYDEYAKIRNGDRIYDSVSVSKL